jgi:hypothetical protein
MYIRIYQLSLKSSPHYLYWAKARKATFCFQICQNSVKIGFGSVGGTLRRSFSCRSSTVIFRWSVSKGSALVSQRSVFVLVASVIEDRAVLSSNKGAMRQVYVNVRSGFNSRPTAATVLDENRWASCCPDWVICCYLIGITNCSYRLAAHCILL